MENPGYVYVLKSEINEKLYLGSTNNIDRRLGQHNNGEVSSTKNLKPWKLIHLYSCESIKKARHIEQILKKQKRKLDLEWIISLINKMV